MTDHRLLPALVLTCLLGVPATASAKKPSQAEIEASVRNVEGPAADAIEEAEAALGQATRDLVSREEELTAARLAQDASKIRVTVIDAEIKALDADLAAAAATHDTSTGESVAAAKATATSVRAWRIEQRRVAARAVQVAQRAVTRARTQEKLREHELQRAKLAAWVGLGAGPEVDTELARASRLVGQKRRALEGEDRRLAKASGKHSDALRAADATRPANDLSVQLAEAEATAAQLRGELDETSLALADERAAVARMGTRLEEARAASDSTSAATTDAEQTLAEAIRRAEAAEAGVAERDALVVELRAQLAGDDPARAQESAAMAAEILAMREEVARATEAATLAEAARALAEADTALALARVKNAEQRAAGASEATQVALQEQADRHLQEVATLSETADAVAAERDALQARVAALESGEDGAETRMQELAALRQRMADADRLAASRITALERDLAVRSEDLTRERTRARQAEAELDEIAVQLATLGAESATRQARIDELVATSTAREAEWVGKLDALRASTELSPPGSETEALEAEIDRLDAQLSTARSQVDRYRIDAATQSTRAAELESKVTRAQLRISEAELDAANAQGEADAAVERIRSELEGRIDQQRSRADRAEATVALREADIVSLAGHLETVDAERATLRAGLDAGEDRAGALADDYEARITDLQEELAQNASLRTEQRATTELQLDALRRQVADAVAARDDAVGRLAQLETRVAQLTEAQDLADQARREGVAAARAEASAARVDRDAAKGRLALIEAQLREAKRKIARLQGENDSLWAREDAKLDWKDAPQ